MHTPHTTSGATMSPDQMFAETLHGLKYRWLIKHLDHDQAKNIAYDHNLSYPIASVLATRNITNDEQIRSFLFSSYEQDVPNPKLLKGLNCAVNRIIRAINTKEKILVFGDYDVDGVTAASMILTALMPLEANINFFLPNREKDGYGLSKKAVERALKSGYSLIITVDNGITAFEAAQYAQHHGIDLIITDHHQPHGQIPPAVSIVNPNQSDCPYPYKHLAGVGVAFKLMCGVYEYLQIKQMPEKIYELLLLGTVADVVPLTGENRFWVRYGLHRINQYKSSALQALANNGSLNKESLDSLDIGFIIAPQINALGRLSDPRDAVKFMISSDTTDVQRIGAILKKMNDERKQVEQHIYKSIEQSISNKLIDVEQEYVIIATNDAWPSGVIGLVAGKLVHNYGRPTFLFHLDKDGIAKGSCRSIPEFNIFDALNANSDILIQYGGHACAAGVKIKQENLPLLKERLSQQMAALFRLDDLQPKLVIDAPLQLQDATQKLLSDLEQLEPFGNQNTQPLFIIKDVTLLKQPQILKDKHVKCMIFAQGIIKPVIFFNRPDLLPVLQNIGEKSFHLAAHILKNEWGGSTRIELQGIDIAY